MRKLKLFSRVPILAFLLVFLTTVFGVGNAWAGTYFEDTFSNVGTGSSGSILPRDGWSSSSGTCAPQCNTGVRLGASSSGATLTKTAMSGIEGTKTLKVTIYVARYNTNANTLTITATNGTIASVDGVGSLSAGTLTVAPTANAGVTTTTSAATWTDAYKTEFTITGASKTTTITFQSSSRLILGPVKIEDAPAACSNTVAITKGTETNGTYTLSATSVCGDGDGEDVTISDITPAAGYAFDEITTSASGTVDNVNKKVTGITAATTITVKFKELPKYTVSFSTGAGNPAQADIAETVGGAGITLPDGPTPACSPTWSFAGWAEAAVASETTTAPTLLAAGATYNPTDNVTLYAVYKRIEAGGGEAWVLCSNVADVTAGTYVITWDNTYYLPSETAKTTPDVGSGITVESNQLSNTVTSAMQWTFTGDNTNGYAISHTKNTDTYKLSSENKAQGITVTTDVTDIKWTVSVDATYGMLLQGSDGGTRCLSVYNSGSWRYYVTGNNYTGTLRLYKLSEGSTTYYLSAPTCSTPTCSTPAISGTTPFLGSSEVTITCGTDGAAIYYTTNGDEPTSGSTLYEGAFNITEACTVKAIAIKDGYDNSAVASKAFATIEVLTVAQARTAIDAGGDLSNKYVRGIIYQIDSYNSTYHSLTYWISDNGVDNANPLEVYSGKGIEGADFSGLSDLNVGDKVIVVGTLKKYNSVYEFDKNNELVERTVAALQSVAVSGTPDLVKYGEGQAFDPTGLVVTATYNTGYAPVVTEDIEWNATPSTITASGNVSVTATWGGKTSAAYEVAVTLAEQAPSFSVAAGEYFEAQEIALTAATGAAIYYTLDGTEPTSASTLYENPISLSERATTTIKALAIGERGESQVVSATYNINLPYSIDEAIALIPDAGDSRDNTCVDGVIYKVDFFSETSKYITYWITANGLEQDSLKIYKGKGISGADFASADDLVVGDAVRVYGQLLNYNGKYEMNEGNHLISYTAKTLEAVTVDGAATKTEYAKGEDFEFAGLTARATYDTYYMAEIPFDEVTWHATPAKVTEEGIVNVTATWNEVTSDALEVSVAMKEYAVTFSNPANGSIVVKNNGVAIESGATFKEGTVLTVETTADDYYRLATLTANEADIKSAGQFEVGAAAVVVAATFEAQPVQLLGDLGGAGWGDGILFSETANPEIRTLTLTDLAVGTYSFKLKVNGEWRSNAATFERSYQGANDISGNESNNMTLVVDKAGDYTLTWRFSNESLDFTFPTRDYTLVGVSALTGGYNWGDGLNVEANLLTNVEDGFYSIVKEDLLLAVGSYEYQIARDHDWRGVSNSILSIATSGRYNVTFTFNENGEETNAEAELQEALEILPTIQAAGDWNVDSEWHWIYNDFEPAANKQTASYKVTIDAGDYKFKMINNSNWLGNGANITRAANSATLTANGDDMVLKADVSGEYTFTWTYETNTLVVTFPLKEAGLSWGVDAATAYTVGKEYELPTLSNPNNLENVSYESSAPAVATIAADGTITLVGTGSTVITATSEATSVYKAGVATYTLNVYGPAALAISGEATKTSYEKGDAFDRTGLVASVLYGDASVLVVTDLATWTADPATVTANGNVTVTAEWEGLSDDEEVAVTVKTHKVTFDAEKNHVLLGVKNGLENISSGDEFAKGTVLTVEVELESADYVLATLTANTTDIKATKQFTIGEVDVTIEATSELKPLAPISWSAESASIALNGDVATLPTLVNEQGLTIMYMSNNEEAATIDENTGVITLVGAGVTTITAQSIATEEGAYRTTFVTYTLTVVAIPTALDNAEAGEKAQKIMLNNQLFILRGGKIYDAQGKLVK